MRIGIDIDGVLTDVIRYACDYGSKYFFEKYGKLDFIKEDNSFVIILVISTCFEYIFLSTTIVL